MRIMLLQPACCKEQRRRETQTQNAQQELIYQRKHKLWMPKSFVILRDPKGNTHDAKKNTEKLKGPG